MGLDELFRKAEPVVDVRGVHLDLKGSPPTSDRLMQLLDIIARCRYNALLVEWEDAFPWTVDERFRSLTAYDADEIARFHAQADRLGLQVIPLIQCLGHMETPLSVPGYESLREVPYQAGVLNPLAEGARELVMKMVDDVVAATPTITHLHLGGDEAWSFGTHPDTKAYVDAHGKGALYMHFIEPILDSLIARNIRPILWHDMMQTWDDAALASLAAKADLCVWGYGGHPDTTTGHHRREVIEHFHDRDVAMWGGAAYKGAGGEDADLTDNALHTENALGWAEVAGRYGFKGVFATAWSRYSTHNIQCETTEASLDSLVNVGVILHDGEPPAGGIDACIEALGDLGERERFDASHAAMAKLTEARDYCWGHIREIRQQLVLAELDAGRRSGSRCVNVLRLLRNAFHGVEVGADLAREAYAGLIPKIWVEQYIAERLEPIREEVAEIDARVRKIDPDGYAGTFA